MRTVNRLVKPQTGRIYVDGTDTATLDDVELRRSIGYVIQAVGLFGHMTIAQNVAVVPSLLHWEPSRIAARVDELLSLVELPPERYRARYPHELSGGEQQRVGVARAIAAEPRALLMDEPFGALDAIVRGTLQAETKRIANVLETTILFVTHDVDEALLLADRIVVMREGAIVQFGTPLEILKNPASEFVERLLDTHDVVRRLQLLRAADAMEAGAAANGSVPAVAADATLREALNLFLDGATSIAVIENGNVAGSLTMASVVQAIGAKR